MAQELLDRAERAPADQDLSDHTGATNSPLGHEEDQTSTASKGENKAQASSAVVQQQQQQQQQQPEEPNTQTKSR